MRSCKGLLDRLEQSTTSSPAEARLEELVLLSTKQVTRSDWQRLIQILLRQGSQRTLHTLRASGHAIPSPEIALELGRAIHKSSETVPWRLVALGDCQFGSHNNDSKTTNSLDQFMAGLDSPAETLQLASLDLSYKGLSRTNLESILVVLTKCSHLQEVDLSRNPNLWTLPDKANDNISNNPTTRAWFPHVERLNLSSTAMTGNCAQSLLQQLSGSGNCVTLTLAENPIGREPLDVLGRCPWSIQELSLAHCHMDDASFPCLQATTVLSLKRLDVSHNQLTAVSMTTLASWLASDQSRSLENLNLSFNPLTAAGVETLVRQGLVPRQAAFGSSNSSSTTTDGAAATSSALSVLDLSHTQCGVDGAIMAMDKSHVASLRLFDNQLGDAGFHALKPYLWEQAHETLETLDLAGNGASQEAVVGLLQSLVVTTDHNSSDHEKSLSMRLRTIVVGGNGGGPELERVVQQIQKAHPKLDVARDRPRA